MGVWEYGNKAKFVIFIYVYVCVYIYIHISCVCVLAIVESTQNLEERSNARKTPLNVSFSATYKTYIILPNS